MFSLFVPLALQTGPHPRLWLAHVRKTFQHRNHNPPPTILLSSFLHFFQHLIEPWLIALIKEIELCPNKSLHNWFLILIQKLKKKKRTKSCRRAWIFGETEADWRGLAPRKKPLSWKWLSCSRALWDIFNRCQINVNAVQWLIYNELRL